MYLQTPLQSVLCFDVVEEITVKNIKVREYWPVHFKL